MTSMNFHTLKNAYLSRHLRLEADLILDLHNADYLSGTALEIHRYKAKIEHYRSCARIALHLSISLLQQIAQSPAENIERLFDNFRQQTNLFYQALRQSRQDMLTLKGRLISPQTLPDIGDSDSET